MVMLFPTLCIDNFFPNPDKILKLAQSLEFNRVDAIPGYRSAPLHEIDYELYNHVNLKIAAALYPRITLSEPPTIALPANPPSKTFESPDVISAPAPEPTAVLLLAVDFLRASKPIPVLLSPVASSPALDPIYVVPPFVVVYEPALSL